jgi:hypothetical protein
MAFYDPRACTTCGVVGFTRHTCPLCPCNFCKKPGHAAPSCTKLQERSQRVGSSANRNSVASGHFSSPSSTRRKQTRLTHAQIAGLVAASSVAAATSADEGRSSGASSDSQHPYAHDTSLLPKGKREPESENARKKSATSSTGNRESNSDNVSPLLDDEVNYPDVKNLHAGLTIEYRLLNLDASQQSFQSWSPLPLTFCGSCLLKNARSTSSIIRT